MSDELKNRGSLELRFVMKSINGKSLMKACGQLLLIAGMVFSMTIIRGDALSLIRQGSSDDKALVGTWELFVTTDGANRKDPPVVVVIQLAGNRLTGKVTVPIVEPSATGIKTTGSKDLTLDGLKLSGRKLSFRVDEEGAELDADLTRINNDEFEGRWRSRIQGRWKGAKNEFEGMLKMKRKK